MSSSVEKISYAKRKWHKARLYFMSSSLIDDNGYKYNDAIFYISDRKYYFRVYSKTVLEVISKIKAQELCNIWFIADSKQYKERWFTTLILKHIETLRLNAINKVADIGDLPNDVLNGLGFNE